MKKHSHTSRSDSILFGIGMIVFMVVILFPFYWILLTSVKSESELFNLNLYTREITFESYISVFTMRPLARYLLNSLIIAGSTTFLAILLGESAAYAFARLRFPGKRFLMNLLLAVSMFPAIATITPIYIFLRNINLRNSYAGLIIPYTAFMLPMGIWYLNAFFREIPITIEEAAKIDGASILRTFARIVVPLAAPGVFTTAILVFIAAWNEYLFAYTLNTDDLMRTVPVGITMYMGQYTVPWRTISAAIIIVTVPLIAMVLVFQKRIVGGLSAGAVKG